VVGLASSIEWLLNLLIGLGVLVLIAGLSLFAGWRKARFDKGLEEADRRYAESEAERKRRESRWSD
jgi:ABC-type lipoprotein release transport system permease subunit